MTHLNLLARALLLMSMLLSSVCQAHPGHDDFGTADDPNRLLSVLWVGVIMALALYGAWRLFRALRKPSKPRASDE